MTTYPNINAGTTPTVAILTGGLPLIADKGGDQSVTSSTVLVNDSALFLPLAANAKYRFELDVIYKGGTTGSSDIKVALTVPSGTTLAGNGLTIANPLGVSLIYFTQATASMFSASNGTGNPLGLRLWGIATTSSTAGNLTLQFAQNTSSGTATTVMAGSSFTAWRRA